MNFDDTPEEAAFRATARAWLDANAPWPLEAELRRAASSGLVGVTSEDPIVAGKRWQKTKAAAGYACPHWPKEYGGGGMTPMQRVIWQQEEGVFSRLSGFMQIGFGMCGPTIMAWGSDEQKRERLPPMITGDEFWCQLFSEPAGGSDLAGLRTRAEPAPDGSGDWIVNGQKIWSSGAHEADYGLLILRTDPTVPKHKGLSMFCLDMRLPGIELRPIKQINGQADFNEVFFTDVRIPDSQRIGPVGKGWEVSLTTLMNERASIGSVMSTGFEDLFGYVCRLETPYGLAVEDRAIRSQLANWAVRASGLKYTNLRAISSISRGENPGPELSISKLVASSMKQDISIFAMGLQAQAGILVEPEEASADGMFQTTFFRSPAMRVEGGSDEILRNIIGERVLGLPGDIRVDKDVPYNKIPTKGR